MADSHFQCKQFFIKQSKDVFPITTDSILLGSWVQANNPTMALDIGCGTGILSLMLAQRYPFIKKIVAIDKSLEAVQCAQQNFANSSWHEKLSVECTSWNNFLSNDRFDLIICNPPYFTNSLPSENLNKSLQRHAAELDFNTLATVVTQHLSSTGSFGMIIPANQESMLSYYLNQKGLLLNRLARIFNTMQADASLILMEFSRNMKSLICDDLFLIDEQGNKTIEYNNLTKDFYLDEINPIDS